MTGSNRGKQGKKKNWPENPGVKLQKKRRDMIKKRVSNREDPNALDVVTMQLRSKSSVIKKQQQDIFMLS